MKTPIITAPSVLAADFSDLRSGLAFIHQGEADWIHMDVMDGHFVPNISFGPKMVADLRRLTKLPLDVHLMITDPEHSIDTFAAAGADYLTVHVEATVHVHRVLQAIRDAGVRPGIAIVPSTPVSAIQEILPFVDLVLVMTVNPGFGGQAMIPETLEKVSQLRAWQAERNAGFHISVDGGINPETASTARRAGANVLVSGSAFFRSREPRRYLQELRGTGSVNA